MEFTTSLGELISQLYEAFLTKFGDKEIASVATAAVINDLLAQREKRSRSAHY